MIWQINFKWRYSAYIRWTAPVDAFYIFAPVQSFLFIICCGSKRLAQCLQDSSTGIINSIIDFVCMNYHATNGKHIPPARRKLRKQMNFNGCLHIDTHDWQSDKMDPVSIFVAECVKNVRRKLSGNSLPEVMVRAVW